MLFENTSLLLYVKGLSSSFLSVVNKSFLLIARSFALLNIEQAMNTKSSRDLKKDERTIKYKEYLFNKITP